jgi:hypothetical protein
METRHSKATILSMAVIASGVATLAHEGLGHGVIAWLRGDIPTELTSNHLSTLRPDRWVDAGGTLLNLLIGAIALLISRRAIRPNTRYFFWIFSALNLLPGAGYFLFSGIFGFGDWYEIIHGLPHEATLRIAMTVFGAALYLAVVRLLAIAIRPFVAQRPIYNIVGRFPYLAACLFSCAAGAMDPLGIKLFLISTVPAAFGGSSGLLWTDSLMPSAPPQRSLAVQRAPAWWLAAAIFAISYIIFVGRGIHLSH